MPTIHLTGASLAVSGALAVAEVVVRTPQELAPALAQHEKKIVIDNPQIAKHFIWLAYWREAKWPLVAFLIYHLLQMAIAHHYKIEAEWHMNWKIERSVNGKITLHPPAPTPNAPVAQPHKPTTHPDTNHFPD